jgi:hypothetical protein
MEDMTTPAAFMTWTPDGLNLVMSLTWRGDDQDWTEEKAATWCLENVRDSIRQAMTMQVLKVQADREAVLLQRTGEAFWAVPVPVAAPSGEEWEGLAPPPDREAAADEPVGRWSGGLPSLADGLGDSGFDLSRIEETLAQAERGLPSNGRTVEAPIKGLLLVNGAQVPLQAPFAAEVVEVLRARPWSSISDIAGQLQEAGQDVADWTVRTRITELERLGVLQTETAPARGKRKRRVLYALQGAAHA